MTAPLPNLDALAALAEKAKRGGSIMEAPPDVVFRAACSPDTILALIARVREGAKQAHDMECAMLAAEDRAEQAEAALAVYQNVEHGPGCAYMAIKYEGRIQEAEAALLKERERCERWTMLALSAESLFGVGCCTSDDEHAAWCRRRSSLLDADEALAAESPPEEKSTDPIAEGE